MRSERLDRTLLVGLGLAGATALISGVSVFVNSYAVKELTDPGVFTTLKNALAAMILLALGGAFASRRASLPTSRRDWAGLGLIGIVGGSIPFLLFFTGLSLASAPSAAFIHKTLFVWVALLAVPLLGERLGWVQVGAMAVLLAGQLLIVPPAGVSWGVGETMIAVATLLWAVEVVIAKRLLARVDPIVLGASRLGIGLIVLVGYLLVTGKAGLVGSIPTVGWAWIAITGILLAAYVGTWFSALSRAPATVVTAMLVGAAPITALLDAVVNGRVPAPVPLAGHALVLLVIVGLGAVVVRRSRMRQGAPLTA